MGRYIIKLDGHYLEWSTVVDAPVTFGMTLEELRDYYRGEYGYAGSQDLDERLARVEIHGTSAYSGRDVLSMIRRNRAGPGEVPLHVVEIIEFYVKRRRDPTTVALAEFRTGLEKCGDTCPTTGRNGAAEFCPRCWGTLYAR